jgi:hypothetical protein
MEPRRSDDEWSAEDIGSLFLKSGNPLSEKATVLLDIFCGTGCKLVLELPVFQKDFGVLYDVPF